MKRYLPHLLYLALIAAVGLFYWQRLKSDNQRISLLNRTTDEAIASVDHSNGELQKSMREHAKEYPSLRTLGLVQMALKADSLIEACGTDPIRRDSLASHLEVLTDHDPQISKRFKTLWPPKKQSDFSPDYQPVLSQNDNLLRLCALTELLYYYASQAGGTDLRFDVYQPAVSPINICQGAGMPFESEIALTSYKNPQLLSLSANGQNLVLKDDIAHFVHTFPGTGVYPLHVKAEVRNFDSDSLRVAEKTFYLHVNN